MIDSIGHAGGGAQPRAFSSIDMPDLVGMVESQLLEAIVAGRIRPGERIVEAELARQMNVSRAPVREAARRLESQGILVSRPRHGFAVRTYTVKQLEDLYQVRVQLEVMAARLACEHAGDAPLHGLLTRVDQMVLHADDATPSERVSADHDFHTTLCALSGNDYLQRMFGHLQTEVRMIQAMTDESFQDARQVAEYHRPIATAMVARDADAAERALRHHLDDGFLHVRTLYFTHFPHHESRL